MKTLLCVMAMVCGLIGCGHKDPILKSKLTEMVAALSSDKYVITAMRDLDAILKVNGDQLEPDQKKLLQDALNDLGEMQSMLIEHRGGGGEKLGDREKYKTLLSKSRDLIVKAASTL